jgi:hypothetical protein
MRANINALSPDWDVVMPSGPYGDEYDPGAQRTTGEASQREFVRTEAIAIAGHLAGANTIQPVFEEDGA